MGSKTVQAPAPPPAPMPAAPPPPVAARPVQLADAPTRAVSQSGLGKGLKRKPTGLLTQKPKRRLGSGSRLYNA